MSEMLKRMCDNCGSDLSYSYRRDRFYVYMAPRRAPDSPIRIDVAHMQCPLDGEHHFCCLDCVNQ